MDFQKIVFASRNKGKITEIREMLAPFNIEVLSALDLNLPDVEETGATFEENAKIKALSATRATGLVALGDDSGLCVNALNGRPGVYSARYAPQRNFELGMQKLLDDIAQSGSDDRSAYFACTLVLAFPNGQTQTFEGRVDGIIGQSPRGSGGFGYDPLFLPLGQDKSFAELSADYKNKTSHRARAMAKFLDYLRHN